MRVRDGLRDDFHSKNCCSICRIFVVTVSTLVSACWPKLHEYKVSIIVHMILYNFLCHEVSIVASKHETGDLHRRIEENRTEYF